MKRNKQIGCVSVLFFLTFFALAASSLPAEAVSTYWQADPATPASWHDPLNWTVRVPIAGDFARVNNGGTAIIFADFAAREICAGLSSVGHIEQSGGIGTVSSYLYLGYGPSSTGTYNLNDGYLSAPDEYVGRSGGGVGAFIQSGGTNEAGYLYVRAGSSYTLSGGTLSISNSTEISSTLDFADGTGSLEVNGGLANFSRATITGVGSASFSSAPDTFTIFPAGFDPASFGSYNPSGLVRVAGSTIVINAGESLSGQGILELTDPLENMGTISEKGGVLVLKSYGGLSVRGTGKIYSATEIHLDKGAAGTLEDDGMIWGQKIWIGETSGTNSTLTQNGGINTVSGTLYLGYGSGSTGTYNLISGQLSATNEYIGNFGTAIFSQAGGTNTASFIALGAYGAATGTYNLSGGQLSAAQQFIGYEGQGAFNQSGGTNAVSSEIHLGCHVGSTGKYNLNGGQLSAEALLVGGFIDPFLDGGTGIFTQTEGTNTVSKNLILGNAFGSTGTYNLSGGQLSAKYEYLGYNGAGTFVQDGAVNTCQYLTVGPTVYRSNESVYTFHAGQLNAKDIYVTPYGYFANSGGPGVREIFVTHSFLNESTYNEQFRLLNTTLILLGDGPNSPTTLDTNSLDMGLGLGGYYDNFALGDLIFRGSTIAQYHYKLLSDVYTLGLVIEDGAIVDLNGYNIYYIPMGGTIHQPPYYEPLSPSTFYLGGTWMNGEILPAVTIPEPATISLLALGALGVLVSLRRRTDRA